MFERYVLVYIFLCFAIGIACLGVTLVLARRKDNHVARAFLAFYAVISLLVISGLLLSFADAFPGAIDRSTRFVLEYIQSIPGFYGLMFTLPFFVHRIYGVESRARDRFFLLVTVLAALGQHVTEYALDDLWDQRGDHIENALFIAVVAYTFWIAFTRRRSGGIDRLLATRFLVLGVVAIPGLLYDVLIADAAGLRVYPIFYCVLSVVVTWTLVHQPAAAPNSRAIIDCGLSDRETEVLHLVQRGLSNKGIADKLYISPNTVKTHLRAIFEKTGVRSRFELIALDNEGAKDLLQVEDDAGC